MPTTPRCWSSRHGADSGTGSVDPLLALRSGIRPLPEVFPARLELEFDGDPSQPWFRRGRWTSSPVLNPNSR